MVYEDVDVGIDMFAFPSYLNSIESLVYTGLMFIDNLFIAARVYFESKNISVFKLEDFIKVVKFVVDRGTASSSDVYRELHNQLRCSERDVSGYLSLGWHLGIFAIRSFSKRSGFKYVATGMAKEIVEQCKDLYSHTCLEALRSLFLRWEPLRVLLRFLRSCGEFRSREIVKVLGEEMMYWNSKLVELGLPVECRGNKAPRKPYNDFVVRKLFKPLIEELQLRNAPLPEEKGYTIVKSRFGEPIIAAGIAHIISSSRECVLVTPFIDGYGVEFVLKALRLSKEQRYIGLIVRRPRPSVDLEKLKREAKEMGIEVDVHVPRRPLHAKVYASENEALITSANLLETSLLRNVEIGIDIRGHVYEVKTIVNDLVYS